PTFAAAAESSQLEIPGGYSVPTGVPAHMLPEPRLDDSAQSACHPAGHLTPLHLVPVLPRVAPRLTLRRACLALTGLPLSADVQLRPPAGFRNVPQIRKCRSGSWLWV